MCEPEAPAKQPMTEEERLALAQRLDKELDDFIDGLEKKRYTEGWPEDKWQEEMEKHPFFMKSVPTNGELPPMAEGLAKLKYDPEENAPRELATNYKEDGNFNFKHKNYRLAIMGYTEGIKVKCGDPETEASLYNNRAAAHYHLKNYRSCLADCEKALTFNPDHAKARSRAAKSAVQIYKFESCIEHCRQYLERHPDDHEMTTLLYDAKKRKVLHERDQRKQLKKLEKASKCKEEILTAIRERGIRIANLEKGDELEMSMLEPSLPEAGDSIVWMDHGILRWPILILYPEYGTTDYIRNCPDDTPLIGQLELLFPAPWDQDSKYSPSTVNVYFEGSDKKAHKVDPHKNIADIMVQEYFELRAGTPAFFVVARQRSAEKRFLETYK